jgi:preflagellin peptidase FlaK
MSAASAIHKCSKKKAYTGLMELLIPMVISAVAVLATLIYTSYLDIRDRRVPFIHWLPMLAIGICCTSYLLWQTTANLSLVFGYLSLVASFLYADYLDNRGRTDSLGLTVYYRKASIGYYLALVLILPALSWFVLAPSLNLQLVAWYGMFAGIFGYVSYMEYTGKFEDNPKKQRKKQDTSMAEAISRWYFVLVVISLAIGSFYLITSGSWKLNDSLFIILPAVFGLVFYVFGRMHLFGGADAWALIFISFCVPTFPFTPLLGNTPLGFLAFSVLINALLLNLVAPLGIFAINIVRGNRAPFMYRKFIGFWDAIKRMYAGEGRVYTKDLREHPEEFKTELAIYKKAGTVWISYAVPFIIPITAGFITAIIFGDFLLAITRFFFRGA